MCTYSDIADQGIKDLTPLIPNPPFQIGDPRINDLDRRVKVLEDSLKQAKIYDETFDQPDCELESKKQTLRDLAEQLGVEIHLP